MSSINCADNINYFQATSFRVIIDRRDYGTFQFFVSRVSHPGVQNAAAETAYPRIGSFPLPGNTMSYGELSMEVLLDEDFRTYTELYDWMLRLVNEEQIAQRNDFVSSNSPTPTYADIHVVALSNHNNKNVEIRYKDCVITGLGDINFNAQDEAVSIVTFPANFRFSHFEVKV